MSKVLPSSGAGKVREAERSHSAKPPDRPGHGVAAGNASPDPRERLPELLPSLRAFAIGLSRNMTLADDLVQDTILKAWSNMDKFDPTTNLEAWLFTILRNTYYSSLRKSRREVSDTDGHYAATLYERPAHDAKLAYGDFQRAFDQLSPEHREILLLVGASGYSCEEAAAMTGVAVGTVKSRTSRARKRLAELLHLEEGEGPMQGMEEANVPAMLTPPGGSK